MISSPVIIMPNQMSSHCLVLVVKIEIWTRLFYDIQEVDDILIPKAQKKTYDCISDFDGSQNWICQNKTSENAILNVFIAVRYVVTKFRLLTRYDQ